MIRAGSAAIAVLAWLLPQQPAMPLAYVSNERSSTISVIDTATDRVVRTIPIGPRPRGMDVQGKRLFVALSDDQPQATGDKDAIGLVDALSGRLLRKFHAGTDPERLVVSRDGRLLIAANEDAGTASITEVETNKVLATLVVGIEPEGVALSPDGRWVYVTAETSNTVSVIDLSARKVVSNFLVDPRPRDVAFAPDGRRAYVTAEIGGSVSVVDVATHRVSAVVELPQPAKPVGVAVAQTTGRSSSPTDMATASRSSMPTR